MIAGSLFDTALPPGFVYQPEFVSRPEEAQLVEAIAGVELTNYTMRGFVARRRVAFFGRSYDAGGTPASPIPPFLLALRERVAAWTRVEPDAFVMALVSEYQRGAPIGWHRDAPQYELVAGVSLLSSCRMKFRPYMRAAARAASDTKRTATHEILLEPRSAYSMSGDARTAYEHHIPPAATLRYSITFRTARPHRTRRSR